VAGDEIASRHALRDEEEFLGWANAGREACAVLGRAAPVGLLSEDQRQAVTGMLSSQSRLMILAGDAGTGKTTCLKALVAGIEQAGAKVFGCAPSSGAAEVLRQELTPQADTLQQLLVNETLQRAVRDRVLLVDEAGLISVRQMRDLCRLAAANGNRVILVGDVKQHSSVEAGDALRCLQKFAEVPVFRLTQIRRQRSPRYREAVAQMAKGDAFAAFNHFARLGAVKEISDENALLRLAANDYVARAQRKESCLAISPVWSEIHAFTDEVRRQLRSSGLLHDGDRRVSTIFSLQWTKAQMRDLRNYQPGQVLVFHRSSGAYAKGERLTVVGRDDQTLTVQFEDGGRVWFSPRHASGFDVGIVRDVDVAPGDRLLIRANEKSAHLRNGDLVEVVSFTDKGGILLRDGRVIPPAFREFSHGYATTSHAAQGKTVDHGILLMGEAGIAAANLKQAYVSNSRFRESQTIYTTDRREARAAMMTPGDRKLAREMSPGIEQAPAVAAPIPTPRPTVGPRI
jgi:nucleoside-triphosphatase THEP1